MASPLVFGGFNGANTTTDKSGTGKIATFFGAATISTAQSKFGGSSIELDGRGAGSIKIRDSADVLLAEIPLTDPCGTVNGTTGQLTITMSGRDESADASGTAAYGEFCNSDGTVYLSLPAQAGTVAVSWYIVINTLTIVAGGPVDVLSAVIGKKE